MSNIFRDPLGEIELEQKRLAEREARANEVPQTPLYETLWTAAIALPNAENLIALGEWLTSVRFEFWLAVWRHAMDKENLVYQREKPLAKDWKYIAVMRILWFACRKDRAAIEADLESIQRLAAFNLEYVLPRLASHIIRWTVRKNYEATPHVTRQELVDLGLPGLKKSNISKMVKKQKLLVGEEFTRGKITWARYKHTDGAFQLQILSELLKKWGPPEDFSVADLTPPVH